MNVEIRKKIAHSLKELNNGNLSANALHFFQALGYRTERQAPLEAPNFHCFKEAFIGLHSQFREKRALSDEWKYVDLLFQLSKTEVSRHISLFDSKKVDNKIIEAYLFFVVELTNRPYTRTELSTVTREINKLFPMPVMILFKCGAFITLSVIDRRIGKRDETRDILEKVSLIKDIDTQEPHAAHLRILEDISFESLEHTYAITNFVELHEAWRSTLDTKELNRRFFVDLANWYYWAAENVSFPDDLEKDVKIRNATNLIRLITRIVFIWFIKEKGLVPDTIFQRTALKRIVKDFQKTDKSCNFYNAILQNLFFGTLNQKMGDRKFASDGSFDAQQEHYGVKNLYRYADRFAIPQEDVIALFRDIPFLNGGLFDCLDKPNETGQIQYVDGFTRNSKKRSLVPDFLFFSQEEIVDLNEAYGTLNREYSVHGLINILNSYKFTIAENTPIEEEVALDPELLGKVFENLLASYNPETQSTARNQTGSFYTPREVVEYMVDESLVRYLSDEMASLQLKKDAVAAKSNTDRILQLLSYTENPNPFDEKESEYLVTAIARCKILDPACGSGAFPMGILHKLVHILRKVDTDNKKWKQLQIDTAIDETRLAFALGGKVDRDRRLMEISEIFDRNINEADYPRKLHLIENCIYGIDIQPIAVQIAKLRFFISLIIDQRRIPENDNFGFRSLPNLETKFVAANSLVALSKPDGFDLRSDVIISKEKELSETRHRYFNAKTRKEKLEYHRRDRILRSEISSEIRKDFGEFQRSIKSQINQLEKQLKMLTGTKIREIEKSRYSKAIVDIHQKIDFLNAQFDDKGVLDAADKISSYDIFDQNKNATWFDPEWMFGLRGLPGNELGCFDIVIGNPPWINSKNLTLRDKDYLHRKYQTANGQFDIFNCFIERSFELLADFRILCFITPDRFINNGDYTNLRKYLLFNSKLNQVVALGDGIFENVAMPSAILLAEKSKANPLTVVKLRNKLFAKEQNEVLQSTITVSNNFILPVFSTPMSERVLKIIREGTKPLEVYLSNFRGVEIGKKSEAIHTNKSSKSLVPFLRGGDIDRYQIKTNVFLDLTNPSINYKDASLYKGKKILIRKTGRGINAVIDESYRYFIQVIYGFKVKPRTTISEEVFCGILNSKLLEFYYYKTFGQEDRATFPHLTQDKVLALPFKTSISGIDTSSLEKLVHYVHLMKRYDLDSTFFERLIDAIVYQYYLSEAIVAPEYQVANLLVSLPLLATDTEQHIATKILSDLQQKLSNPSNPVSIALYKLDSIEEIRIIEGRHQP